ncbi:TetR/AcrR family transcriptional regulator [Nonomuraea sp. NBC_01738]|uniref:TetR/AcrR family transcriptional regulator n=1 Tax=Nonomuraea sp. NBC_01738 TaxID=2976003 RepID=UPI002E0F150D|nr:TetR/AcrR family transcriptional regulator [Nonomuraea sp. NBC_01738]
MTSAPMSGRKKQAARNDEVILQAAKEVFTANPAAPIAAVAERAGVGISALYRRYPSKDVLLQKLCADGMRAYNEAAEKALDPSIGPWEAFTRFMEEVVDADTHSLTISLAGTFTPTEELGALAVRGGELSHLVPDRARDAGHLRPDVTNSDVALLFEQLASVRLGDDERTAQLRRRYLALILDAIHVPAEPHPLPGPPPTPQELRARWVPR